MENTDAKGRGAFIVVEGLDRSGKTTQTKRIESALMSEGYKVKLRRFPDRTTVIGEMINNYLQSKSDLEDHVIHLLFSANRWELAKEIEKDIADGITVICDRYYYSGVVYSAAKSNPQLSLPWAREPEVGLPRPDLVVFLDLEPEVAEERGGYGDEKYEKREMQEKVRKLFHALNDSEEEEASDMVIYDAGKSVEEVTKNILQSVSSVAQAVKQGLHPELRKVGKWKREH
ncbi:hypothetical protein V496_09526 [Pseudogymnoascus sp. VKM F-4515 (FW-2607)]|nr:hypothetical protein V496_09526 [Pseudogymnoascus sp. VKM F-4515 (FW-2607)]KFY98239.1 hypothetical protein V498_01592 [Pseudogymnoascus sp. VKM F-4517 (FW-2822)]